MLTQRDVAGKPLALLRIGMPEKTQSLELNMTNKKKNEECES
jgi:hypothetical protein